MGAEITTVSSTGAKKGVKKQRFELIPPRALQELTKLYGRGARKYAPNNFRLGYETSKSYGAGQRHAVLFWSGENLDTETDCHHLASFVWHCFTILESNVTHPEFDDRPYGANHLANGREHSATVPLLSLMPAPQEIPTESRHDLLPLFPFAQVAEVFGTNPGLATFADDVSYGTLYGLAQDHANRYWGGEDADEASGLPNLAWAAAYGLILIELTYARPMADDRFLPGANVGFDSVPVATVPVDAVAVETTAPISDDGDDLFDPSDVAAVEQLLHVAAVQPVTREPVSPVSSQQAPEEGEF